MKKGKEPVIGILTMKVYEENDCIIAGGTCFVSFSGSRAVPDTSRIHIDVRVKQNALRISFGSRYGKPLLPGKRLNTFRIEINRSECAELDVQNKLIAVYEDEDGNTYTGRILYSLRDLKKGHRRNSNVLVKNGTSVYFRQSRYNSMVLTIRDTNIYDTPEGQKRLRRAQKNARKLKDQDIILMYEKNCSRYEESASVLYEKLIDLGYNNAFFIADPEDEAVKELPEKYRRNIIAKDSDKHLEYFFASNKFIASESTEHALQLRIASKAAMDKINSPDLQYIFLQHGVMYMVSLDSGLRTSFRKNNEIRLHRTVVSSEAEAKHFTDLAGMEREDLYVTGLAKFDKSFRYEDADRIIIMPTWRRWEANLARTAPEETGYFRMLQRMYNAVPDNLKEKVIVLPHPLMSSSFAGEDAFDGHIVVGKSYDRLLRTCDLLITDYSSIAYDAFYRGANVIFCWEDLEECMKRYGEKGHLMLTEELAFGPVCDGSEGSQITEAIGRLYRKSQPEEYIDNYKKLVSFNDGHNSDRIVECLRRDGVIN